MAPAVIITTETGAPPTALAGHLTGQATSRRRAEALVMAIAVIREKELPATKTFAPTRFATHRNLSRQEKNRKIKSENRIGRTSKTKKEEQFWNRIVEENPDQENGISNRRLSSTFIPPLTSLSLSPNTAYVALQLSAGRAQVWRFVCEPIEHDALSRGSSSSGRLYLGSPARVSHPPARHSAVSGSGRQRADAGRCASRESSVAGCWRDSSYEQASAGARHKAGDRVRSGHRDDTALWHLYSNAALGRPPPARA